MHGEILATHDLGIEVSRAAAMGAVLRPDGHSNRMTDD
jgi:hypothetical protein